MQHAWGPRNCIQQFDGETATVRRTYGQTLPDAQSVKRRMVEWAVDNQLERQQSVNVTFVAQNTSDTSVSPSLYTIGGGTVSSVCSHRSSSSAARLEEEQ